MGLTDETAGDSGHEPAGQAGATPGAGLLAPSRRAFLTASVVSAAAVAAVPLAPGVAAADGDEPADLPPGPGSPTRPQRPDAQLRAMLREVDPGRIEASVRRLAAFGTRHTLSSQDDPVRGIGAARDWLFDQFQAIAATSGGRMTVEKQTFTQPPGP